VRGSWIRAYMPPGKDGRIFAVTSLVDSMGTGFYLAGSSVFFARSVGLTSSQIGFGLGIAGLIAFLATVPLGTLGDRLGALRLLRQLQLWRALWYGCLAFVHGPLSFLLVICMLGLSQGSIPPLTQAVIGTIAQDQDRSAILAVVRTVRNAGFSAGALATAPLLALGTPWAFRSIILANSISYVLVAVLLRYIRVSQATASDRRSPIAVLRGFRNWRYVALAAVSGIVSLHMTLLAVGIPLWTAEHTHAPTGLIGILTLVNTLIAIAFQVPLTRAADRPRGSTQALRFSGIALAACCLVLALAGRVSTLPAAALLVLAMVLMTFGEIFEAIGSWDLSYRYTQADSRATYLSVFSLGMSAQEIAGPILVGAVVIGSGAQGWAGLTMLFIATSLSVGPVVSALDRRCSSPALAEIGAPGEDIRGQS
jgi:MFS family permease